MTAAKNAIVSWLLNFTIRMFVKSAVKIAYESKHIKPTVFIRRGFYSLFRRQAQTFEVIIPICRTVFEKSD